jgi:hypothetical protein
VIITIAEAKVLVKLSGAYQMADTVLNCVRCGFIELNAKPLEEA